MRKASLKYYGTKFLRSMSFEKFYGIFEGILLERSHIFISNSKNKMTAALLGIRALLYPFTWWHTFIPTLPTYMIDILDAPVPILIGLSKEQFKEINHLNIPNRTWVFLDEDRVDVREPLLDDGEQYIYDPHLGGLHDLLKVRVN